MPTPRQIECLKVIASEHAYLDQEDERLAPFCDDKPSRHDTDTFNECIAAGWVKAWHNDLHDYGGCEITKAGLDALASRS